MLGEPPRSDWDLHFQLFGIPVRVHPFFWLIAMLFGLSTARGDPAIVLNWVIAVFLSILIHELGHAFAARAYGAQPSITLHGWGGLASYQPTRRDPASEIIIALAGPAAGFLLAALIVGLLRASGHEIHFFFDRRQGIDWYFELDNKRLWLFTEFMLFINIFWGLVNLLPIYPLDGGQITRQLFHLFRAPDGLRTSLMISVGAAAAVGVYAAFVVGSVYMAIFFGYFAYTNYVALQSYYGSGGGFGGGWR